ncbi:hypothetical protein E308F_25930 [Moorella sp. E308F]|uniref:VirB4 family type IV secretion system protein n=1 Tax=Moorella sp. E308F TaxID=2572682 RepID=UPI0010FFC580|nr:ATP-binding protein [Moorella sp. E308F]MDK2895801.1 hypothetical protein [Moorella sp. (in: firmicutes)]GEA16347.1 hypothetical protein E308F_25930 [Moorella sp. E308F]
MSRSKTQTQQTSVLSGLLDVLSPQALDFGARQITFGEQLARAMVITDYPPRVGPAWLARVAGMPGVAASIHVNPTDPANLVLSINRAIGEYTGRLELGGNALVMQRTEHALKDAQELLKKIDQEQQQVFYVTVVLLILAHDQETLDRRTRQVEAALAAAGMRGRAAVFRQEEGLKAAGPWAVLPSGIKDAGARNMPAETVAASFPFTASGINDGSGVVLGRDRDGGLVLVDIWQRGGDRTNSNWTVLAKPGAGKSFAVKMLILRELARGARVIIIDPEREYREMCRLLNGAWINCAGGKGRINPLQVRPVPVDDEEGEEDKVTARGPLALHLQTLRTFFSLYLRDLSDLERAALEEALVEVYRQAGVGWQTDPAEITAENWPTPKELYAYVAAKAGEKPETYGRLAVLLRRAAEGADASLWAGPTTASADNDLIVLDVHDLQNADDAVRRAQYFNVLSFAWHQIEKDRQERTLLVVDEAWLLVDPQTPQALAFLRDTSKRIRKYMGGLVVISQNVIDFLAPEVARHGQALLDNPTYKLLLAQGEKDLEAITTLMNLSEAEHDLLASAKRGEGLLVAGTQRVQVRIEAAPYEMPYLTGGGQ